MKVLLVDDNTDYRVSMAMLLGMEGHETLPAGTVRQAIDILKNGGGRPDLVMLDLVLPDGSGERVIQVLETEPALKGVPVLAVTAMTPAKTEDLLARRPDLMVLHKPADPDVILRVAREVGSHGTEGEVIS